MPIVLMGNHAAINHKHEVPGTTIPGRQVTKINVSSEETLQEQMRTITHRDGFWFKLSMDNEPRWVWSEDPELEAALADYYRCSAASHDDAVEMYNISLLEGSH
jgi:hypothetical protein